MNYCRKLLFVCTYSKNYFIQKAKSEDFLFYKIFSEHFPCSLTVRVNYSSLEDKKILLILKKKNLVNS